MQNPHDQKAQILESLRANRRRIIAITLLFVILIAAFVIGQQMERKSKVSVRHSLEGRFDSDYITIEYNGAVYRSKPRVTSILFMGVDQLSDENSLSTGSRNGGQADFLLLGVIDDEEKTVRFLQIDRDTMTPIQVLGVLGNLTGKRTAQICLSHGFGDGKKQSCGFTKSAVEELLGVSIDYYVAMNMDGISEMNDALGGVPVTVEDDFSMFDPAMVPGAELTLMGDQAEYFVRYRMGVGDSTNATRMVRQRQYMASAMKVFDERVHQSTAFINTFVDSINDYMITNMSKGRMANEAARTRDYVHEPTIALQGTHGIGADGFMEFYADQELLIQTVIDLYYEVVE